MKDNTVQKGQVKEVTTDKVKFIKYSVPTGPTYEVFKSEVIKIRYSNGYIDIIDKGSLSDTSYAKNENNRYDSINYCMIYIVNTDDQGAKLKFPIYLNGKYIFTIKRHGRATIKLFSVGSLMFERQPKEKTNLSLNLTIQVGKSYGITIDHSNPRAMDRNKRFSVRVVDDRDFERFMEMEFYNPNLAKKRIKVFQEDPRAPIIKE